MRSSRISPDNFDFAPRHQDATRYVDDLILDLKLQMLGYKPRNPITMERLHEWHQKHARDLDECKTRIRFY